jgi:hypothetical protein
MKQMLGEAAALSLDSAILSSTAAVPDVRPAGILAGLTPITATAGGGTDAMTADLQKLVAALATAGGGTDQVIIAAPQQALALKLTAGAKFNAPVLASAVLAAGTVIAIEPSSFVSTVDATPEFNTSSESAIHEDTAPVSIGTPGSPNATASPTRSLFQTDCTAIRMILRIGWAMRAAHVAHVTGATW